MGWKASAFVSHRKSLTSGSATGGIVNVAQAFSLCPLVAQPFLAVLLDLNCFCIFPGFVGAGLARPSWVSHAVVAATFRWPLLLLTPKLHSVARRRRRRKHRRSRYAVRIVHFLFLVLQLV
jgi:hypothetical protein